MNHDSTPDHETALLAAVLLAQRAQAGEDVSEATERLAELASGEEDGGDDADEGEGEHPDAPA